MKRKSYLYTAILFLALFGIYQYGIHQIYGMVEYPDEFGYWSTAASMNSWDWSQMASRGSYYSFGYSLILFPILKFCEDSVTAYRMAVTVNFSLIIVSFFLLKGIYKRIFTEQVEGEGILAIGMTLLYPAWSFYAQTTMVDSQLMFMVILICYLWVRFVEVPKFGWGVMLVAAVMYNYSLHMRSVGILAALVIVIMIWGWKNPSYRKGIFFLLLAVVCLFGVIGWTKDVVQGNVFGEAGQELLKNNDYGGQWSKVAFLFSLDGLKQLFAVTMGKILYLGIASAGLVFTAIVWGGRQVYDCWKYVFGNKKTDITKSESGVCATGEAIGDITGKCGRNVVRLWLGLFFLLLVLGQLAVCIIYTIHSSNADWLIYGRYIESFIPIGIFIGASYTLQKAPEKKVYIGLGIVYTLAACSCIYKLWGQANGHIRGEHSVATIFLIGDGNVDPVQFFIFVWLAGMILMIAVRIGLRLFVKNKFSAVVIIVLFLMQTIWCIHASEEFIYRGNDNMAKELIIVNVLEEQLELGKDIYYLEEGNADWISYVQMQLRENTLHVISEEELKKLDSATSAVVVDGETEFLEFMEANYNRRIPGDSYYAFYNK